MKLTSGDKKLIYSGALLAAVSLCYMLIISPMAERVRVLRAELEDCSAKADTVISQSAELDRNKKHYGLAEEKYHSSFSGFCGAGNNESVDELLTGTLLEMNLSPVSLDMVTAEGKTLIPYNFTDSTEMSSYAFSYSEYIIPIEVRLSMEGSFSGALKYMDFLNETEGVAVNSVSFKTLSPNGAYSSGIIGSMVRADICLTVYTYDSEGFLAAAMPDEQEINNDR